jgi:four helix bundle protein
MENNTDKQYPFFRFEDLRVYHKALDYITWVNDVTKLSPDTTNVELNKRFNFSAQNIALNIAEGSARSKTQFIYHLKLAKSSLRECLVFTTISSNFGLFTEDMDTQSRGQLMELTKMIGALISSLQRTFIKDEDEEKVTEEQVTRNTYLT